MGFCNRSAPLMLGTMRRIDAQPHPDWPAHSAALGLAEPPGWGGDAAYILAPEEIDALELAAQRIEDICLDTIGALIAAGPIEAFGLDETAWAMAAESWVRQDKNLIGCIDLSLTAEGTPRLMRYQAVAPQGLLAASVLQAEWRECHRPSDRQFNQIHETLVQAWRHFGLYGHRLHFLHDAAEGQPTLAYLRETALQAGIETVLLGAEQLVWNGRRLLDQGRRPITRLYLQRPWQDLTIASLLRPSGVRVIEPAWKSLMESDAFLPWLRRRYPDEAMLGAAPANGTILGLWVIASQPCGLGIRDAATGALIPHYVEG